jgi:putative ABC transport system substrate-binding protein
MGQFGRRRFLVASATLLTGASAIVQGDGRMPRIAVLSLVARRPKGVYDDFEAGLRELGYVDGKNFVLDFRDAGGRIERLPQAAAELVRDRPDVIVVGANPNIKAVLGATSKIPVVMFVGVNVVNEGFVASLARPGGNLTGLTWDAAPETWAKMLEFLKEALPELKRVANMYYKGDGVNELGKALDAIAKHLNITRVGIEVGDDFEAGFRAARREGARAIVFAGSVPFYFRRTELVALARRYGIPGAYPVSAFAEAGGLLSYSPSLRALARRAAYVVDRILKGAKPADIPIERPTTLELVVNRGAARELGITLPQSLLLRADRVIE